MRDAFTLGLDAGFAGLVGLEEFVNQLLANLSSKLRQQLAGVFFTFVQGQAHAQTKFGVVFKKGIGPGWTAAFSVLRPGCSGQVSAING